MPEACQRAIVSHEHFLRLLPIANRGLGVGSGNGGVLVGSMGFHGERYLAGFPQGVADPLPWAGSMLDNGTYGGRVEPRGEVL